MSPFRTIIRRSTNLPKAYSNLITMFQTAME